MIFMCVTKVSNRHFWTQTMASDNNHPLNSESKQIVYSVSEFSLGWGSVISRECGDSGEALWSVSLLLDIGL